MAEPEQTRLQSIGESVGKAGKKLKDLLPKGSTVKEGIRKVGKAAKTAKKKIGGLRGRGGGGGGTPPRPTAPPTGGTPPRPSTPPRFASTALSVPSKALSTGPGMDKGFKTPDMSAVREPAKKIGLGGRLLGGAARFAGPVGAAYGALDPVEMGNAENTALASMGGRRADFDRQREQGFARDTSGIPESNISEADRGRAGTMDPSAQEFMDTDTPLQSYDQSEEMFREKQALDAGKEPEQEGLRGRGLPAPGEGFIENERTGARTEFNAENRGERSPALQAEHQRYLDRTGRGGNEEAFRKAARQGGMRGRGGSGNPYGGMAQVFGDSARAGLAAGRQQADRGRMHDLRLEGIKGAAAAAAAAPGHQLKMRDQQFKEKEAENKETREFIADFEKAPPNQRHAMQQEAMAGFNAEGPNSALGRRAVGIALQEISKKGALGGERGVWDWISSAWEGSPDKTFYDATGLYLDGDDIMQDTGGGDYVVVEGLDEISDFARNILADTLTTSPEAGGVPQGGLRRRQ